MPTLISKNSQKIIGFFLLFFVLFSLVPPQIQAQITNPAIGQYGGVGEDTDASRTQSGATFVSYFVNIWRAITMVGALAVILFIVWGAFEWITAGGEASKIQKARDKMTQSVIGLIILVGSFVIIGFVGQLFFGDSFDILNPSVPGVTAPGGTYGPQQGDWQSGQGVPVN